jgi:hypothetical protein
MLILQFCCRMNRKLETSTIKVNVERKYVHYRVSNEYINELVDLK